MKLPLALGVALVAMTAAASAHTDERVLIRHHGGHAAMDADQDGWITRAEASAAADRMFDQLDGNDDGRLDEADRAARHQVFEFRHGGGHAPHVLHGENCRRSEDGEGDDRRVTVTCHSEAGDGPEWSEERTVTVVRTGREEDEDESFAPVPPVPPAPPIPPAPMMLMLFGNTEEFDRDGDGALSREEFRAQQLSYFGAGDGNGDGRVRALRAPEPPEPPAPPAPPRRR